MNDKTKREYAIISAHTGFLVGEFTDMHEYIEEILNRPVWTHELASEALCDKIKKLSEADYLAITKH